MKREAAKLLQASPVLGRGKTVEDWLRVETVVRGKVEQGDTGIVGGIDSTALLWSLHQGTLPIIENEVWMRRRLQRCTISSANTCASKSAFLGTRMPRSIQSFPLSGHTLLRFNCLSAGPVGPCI